MDYKQKLERYRKELEGWGFSLPSPKVPRAFSTNVSNDLPNKTLTKPTYEWDSYSGLPGTGAYTE